MSRLAIGFCQVEDCERQASRHGMCSSHHADLTGMTYRQLDYWVHKGYLRPQGGNGSGYARYWTRTEWWIATWMARLVRAGIKPEVAHWIARSAASYPAAVNGSSRRPVKIAAGIAVTITEEAR